MIITLSKPNPTLPNDGRVYLHPHTVAYHVVGYSRLRRAMAFGRDAEHAKQAIRDRAVRMGERVSSFESVTMN